MKKHALLVTGALVALGVTATTAIASSQPAGESYSGDTLVVRGFIGRIEIDTTAGGDVSVAIDEGRNIVERPELETRNDRVVIDGGQDMSGLQCQSRNGQYRLGRRWGDKHDIEDYPTLRISAPASLHLDIADSAFVAEAGDLGSLDLTVNSCGDFRAGDVAGDARVRINGSGDVDAGEIGGATLISINGSGDVSLGDLQDGVDINISGSGDVALGDITRAAEININGSGDVTFGRVAGLDIDVSGSGDVTARHLEGPFDARINGSGDIEIYDGRAEPFQVSVNGSGDIEFGGTAVNLRVNENGSGDVSVDDIEGTVEWRRHGRTVLRVGAN